MGVRYPRNFVQYFSYHFWLSPRGRIIAVCGIVVLFAAPKYGNQVVRPAYSIMIAAMLVSAFLEYYVAKGAPVYRILALRGFSSPDSSDRIMAANVLGHMGSKPDIELVAERLASLKLGDPERIVCSDALKRLQERWESHPSVAVGEHFGKPAVPEKGQADPLVIEAFIDASSGEWPSVVNRLMRYVAQNQEDWAANYFLASASIELGDWRSAFDAAERGRQQIPKTNVWRARTLYVLADAAIMLKKDDYALSRLEEALSLSPPDPCLPVSDAQKKLELLRTGHGQDIRDDTSRDPRFLRC